ncbi:hypothetical protein BDV98DRAFT_80045 [Pterulicium gracile]|uniref:Uncharacterized protein n=1 Tax=Pterulicium gracile TaxID=1884261 RepID=A0A5C3QSQ6_9AGAR|nr:hypothetical protein BDV98DRAFT_80045 [Pterula gracilis]
MPVRDKCSPLDGVCIFARASARTADSTLICVASVATLLFIITQAGTDLVLLAG